ncbi:LysR family transcriptional regulator [Paraburkholderia sp. HD33-4]|uniref:LysR family transcriptional regulator n=1 Tax=Paraburkholderia sp. HD33-4 TaxID=2883242 RepID=UPI001F236629|nr:LysR family transcriptional regulator [Paraburkholderia sp. HD33-4]
MPTPLPPLNALKTFESAARHLSFRRAAQELHVTPAAVSHQVNALEAFLGVLLFERTKKGLVLTQAGRLWLPKLSESFRTMRESIDLLARFKDKETLTVSCPPSFSNRWLMPRLHRFLMQHPELDVHVVSWMLGFGHSWTHQEFEADAVRQRLDEVDLVIVLGDGRYDPLHVDALLPLTLTPLLAPSLAATSSDERPESLAALPLLHDDRGIVHGGLSYWRKWAEFAGIPVPDEARGHHFSHAMTALEAAADGVGVVVSSPALALHELQSGRLVAPYPVLEDCGAAYHAVVAEPRRCTQMFIEWLKAEAQATADALRGLPGYARQGNESIGVTPD